MENLTQVLRGKAAAATPKGAVHGRGSPVENLAQILHERPFAVDRVLGWLGGPAGDPSSPRALGDT